jgi:hypothetical protein
MFQRLHFLAVVAAAVVPALSGCAVLGDYSPLAPLERRMFFVPAKYPAGDWQPTTVLYEDANFRPTASSSMAGMCRTKTRGPMR